MAGSAIVVGHRGAAAYAPENTASSFAEAVRRGADAVECDVRLSRDGTLVVCHDATLDRTTDGRGLLSKKTWTQIRRVDAGSWFHRRFRGERLWRLPEFLAWAKGQKTRRGRPLVVFVEMKSEPGRSSQMGRATARAVGRAGMVSRSWVISFDHAAAAQVKRVCPRVKMGFLLNRPVSNLWGRLSVTGAEGVFPSQSMVTPDFLDEARRREKFVGVWTVDDPQIQSQLKRWGADAIITNRPA